MTLYPELKGNALRAYESMVNKLRQKAMSELKLSASEVVVRPLRPLDINATVTDWYITNNGISSSAYAALTNIDGATIANSRFVGINGIFNQTGASSLHAVRITREGAVAREWAVDTIPAWKHQAAWVDDPVTLDRNTTVTIAGWHGIASTLANTFGFLGAVAEKRGLLINP